ncbi:MAG TPA: O-antigen ligase family protein [Alcaligenaceae bacterium]|nr:O-antigen ligase family protein [Alcaligenaceae bacterium]
MPKTVNATPIATSYCSLAIFLFAALALVVPSGYSIGAVLLLLGGLYALKQARVELNTKDYLLLGALILFSAEGIANNLFHQASSSSYDKIIRFALAVPAFFLIRWAKPNAHWAWFGAAVGAIGAGSFAYLQKFTIGFERAEGHTQAIQFGNLSMLSALFCLAGLGWASQLKTNKKHYYFILLALGALAGIMGSLLSGSRGGWVGLPFVFLVLFKAYHSFFSLKAKLIAAGALGLAALAILSTPQLPVRDRIVEAFHNVQEYQRGNSETSVGARFEMWQGAIQLIKEKPLMGWGKDGYQSAMQALAEQDKADPVIGLFNHAHNDILDQTAKQGLLGLITLLALYLVPLYYFSAYLQHPHLGIRSLSVAGTLLAVAYIDFGFSQAFLTHNNGVMMFAFWLMIWAGLLRNTIEQHTASAATVR